MNYIIGIDEVGRGPIAGPLTVCACAVKVGTDVLSIFPDHKLKDSKKLTEKKRLSIMEQLPAFVEDGSVVFGIGEISAEQLDEMGLSKAIKEALVKALTKVHSQGVPKDSFIFLDGSLKVDEKYAQETIIKGDEKVPEIALASIIAKTHRDIFMKKIADVYPAYGFEKHVGYGTKAHYTAITTHGLTPLHRRSFLKGVL
jgi:ribonuclease HII